MNSSNQSTTSMNGKPLLQRGISLYDSKFGAPNLIWDGKVMDTEISKFTHFLNETYSLHFDSDFELHQWSVKCFRQFWEAVWSYFGIISSQPYEEVFVKTGLGFLDCSWFHGALFNYAENVLRIRDDTVALIYGDEEGNSENITYNELFEEVSLYSAAFRKNGLEKGDRVACHVSNRKEPIFAMLATLSIGAVWGGAMPFFGAKAAANIVSKMDPKFLIAVDRHQDEGKEYVILNNLPTIVNSSPTLEKVIIIDTKKETYSKDISHIRGSCFLQDFLDSGRLEDGTIPEITFEQLPATHPVFISFTSGTTGLPKATVHSSAVLLPTLANIALAYNLKYGDSLLCYFPMGWSPILNFIPCLALGVKLFLHCGSPYYVKNSCNFWDRTSKFNSTFVFHIASVLDNLEKNKIIPGPDSVFENLEIIGLGSCPIKRQNVEYIRNYITKDAFIGNLYASTESVGAFSGFYLSLPSYAGEIQLPALGIDLRCFNKDGESVIGEIGTVVIATPSPSMPLYLWKDTDNQILNSTYFSQFPGIWCQSDLCWINPETKGIVIKGRSDDTFVQNGDRFGAADIYFAIHDIEELEDYICVGLNRCDGDHRIFLFVKMRNGFPLTTVFREKIEQKIEEELFVDCIPKFIIEVKDIPYTLNNKRMESTIRKILETNEIPDVVNSKNPESLKYFCDIPEICSYKRMESS